MSASIRGHLAQVKFFKNGQPMQIVNCTSFEVSQDSSFSRSFYVGAAAPEGDQTVEGWSGSAEFEVKDSAIDDFMDGLITGNLNGVGVDEVTITVQEQYADGQVRAYVYYDIQAKMNHKVGGLQEKLTKRIEFQASGRLSLS